MIDIEKFEGENLGGVFRFRFLPVEEVNEIPETLEGAVHHEVDVLPGGRWRDGYCTAYTMSFKDEQVESEQGSYHQKEFSGLVPKERPELVDLFNSMRDRKFILDVFDNNGTRRLVGTVDEPMYCVVASDSKNAVAERNEHKVVFRGVGVLRSPFYNV
jgi:hypothetical protein